MARARVVRLQKQRNRESDDEMPDWSHSKCLQSRLPLQQLRKLLEAPKLAHPRKKETSQTAIQR